MCAASEKLAIAIMSRAIHLGLISSMHWHAHVTVDVLEAADHTGGSDSGTLEEQTTIPCSHFKECI